MNESIPHILLVEDEEGLGKALQFNLEAENYHVTWVRDGKSALGSFNSETFDLIILDIMLPYIDGFTIAREIRTQNRLLPIIMLTARNQIRDKLHGLELGADDYITKPFHLRELMLKVKRLLERKLLQESRLTSTATFTLGDRIVDFSSLEIRVGERVESITSYEAMVLRYLIEHQNQVVSRGELLKEVWNLEEDTETRTVDIFISRLRKLLEPDPKNPRYLISVRGVGYRLKVK